MAELFFFLSLFGGHIHMSYFEATGVPVLEFLVTSTLGFKATEGSALRQWPNVNIYSCTDARS